MKPRSKVSLAQTMSHLFWPFRLMIFLSCLLDFKSSYQCNMHSLVQLPSIAESDWHVGVWRQISFPCSLVVEIWWQRDVTPSNRFLWQPALYFWVDTYRKIYFLSSPFSSNYFSEPGCFISFFSPFFHQKSQVHTAVKKYFWSINRSPCWQQCNHSYSMIKMLIRGGYKEIVPLGTNFSFPDNSAGSSFAKKAILPY